MPSKPGETVAVSQRRSQREINAQRRRDLIGGVIASVARRGVAATTVQTISAEAGASRGLIAHYFGDKGQLMVAAYQTLCDQLSEGVAAAARSSDGGPERRLHAIVDALFSPPIHDPATSAAFLAFWQEAAVDPALAAANHDLYDGFRDVTTRLVERAAAERGTTVNARLVALGLVAMVDGFWVELHTEHQLSADEAATACHLFIDRCLQHDPNRGNAA